ncbi:MAG: DEAD/DEAH box helicase [Cellulosilyticum sp.]|nr:DEAD/DEAH box helicase [Cellulosilyticum sp.]
MQTFKQYGLSQPILKALEKLNYQKPMEVQDAVLKAFSNKQDLIVQAQTGSGKTLAFALPICEAVDWEGRYPQALVLTPTRELALQIQEGFFKIGRFKRIKAVGLYGKAPFMIQQKELRQKTHVVVATPGRLLEHIEKGTITTTDLRYLIIDEADEMLKMGFMEDVHRIMEAIPKQRQTLLFSATWPKDIDALSREIMKAPQHIQITPQKMTSSQVEAISYEVEEENKLGDLMRLTQAHNPECAMIFCNRRVGVEAVYEALKEAHYACAMLHGGMEQRDRFRVMEDFKKGRYRYLVCTDVAARGIDVHHVTYVVSYDVPEDKEQYVHRIGRTGRGKKTGKAAMLITKAEQSYVEAIEDYIGEALVRGHLPTEAEAEQKVEAFKEKMQQVIEVQKPETEAIHQDILKIHINAGKKTKMRPVDIVGTLCNLPGMAAEDIGIIQIQDISTYVEILNGKGEGVYQQLQSKPIKGRIRRVSKVEHRN